MNNKQTLDTGITMLEALDVEKAEAIDINRTEYDDGSVSYTVSVSLPKPKASN